MLELKITSTPPGDAPVWVRKQWIGLSLPLAQPIGTPISIPTTGVITGPKTFLQYFLSYLTGKIKNETGFLVESRVAINLLALTSPDAAKWWQDNAPQLLLQGQYLVFQQYVGYIIETTSSESVSSLTPQ